MKTTLQLQDKKGIFTALTTENEAAGEMHFNLRNGNIMVITHTRTFEGFEGKGVGSTLVAAGVAYAQEQQYKILPLCSFARAYIERHTELRTILA